MALFMGACLVAGTFLTHGSSMAALQVDVAKDAIKISKDVNYRRLKADGLSSSGSEYRQIEPWAS